MDSGVTPSIVVLDEAGRTAWDDFVLRHPQASLWHQWAWRELAESVFGCRSYYLAARLPCGEIRGVLPLMRLSSRLFGDYIVSLPFVSHGGTLVVDPAADTALMQGASELALQLGVRHAEFRERKPRPDQWPARTDKVVMELPLEASPEAQWKVLGSKLRAQIRRPEREGAVVQLGGPELLDDFYAVFARNMRDLGTPVYSRRLFEQVCLRFPGQTELIVVRIAEQPVAAGLLVHHGGVTEIPWASSLREWNRVGANMLLYWRAVCAAISRQSRAFDFGRSSRDSGTYRFKAQWGAQPSQLYWHYWLPEGAGLPQLNPDNPRFALAVRAWQRLPLWVANRVGPLLVRKLP